MSWLGTIQLKEAKWGGATEHDWGSEHSMTVKHTSGQLQRGNNGSMCGGGWCCVSRANHVRTPHCEWTHAHTHNLPLWLPGELKKDKILLFNIPTSELHVKVNLLSVVSGRTKWWLSEELKKIFSGRGTDHFHQLAFIFPNLLQLGLAEIETAGSGP